MEEKKVKGKQKVKNVKKKEPKKVDNTENKKKEEQNAKRLYCNRFKKFLCLC